MRYILNDHETLKLARSVLGVLNTPQANVVIDLIDQGGVGALKEIPSFDPSVHSVDDFYALSLLKKYSPAAVDPTLRDKSIHSFFESEKQCSRFSPDTCEALLFYMQRFISKVLGEFSIHELLASCKPGRHAAVGAHGSNAHILFHMKAMSYFDPEGLLRCYLYDITGMRGVSLSEAKCSELNFVPKTSSSMRSICIEPSLNMFFQLGLGDMIRRRLKKVGIDLRNQGINQDLALLGSIRERSFCTIDLSMASDLISSDLVRVLFAPLPEWLYHMESMRCTSYRLDSESYDFVKFSSMGNGFTFPLQSLIYAAAIYAVAKVAGVEECLQFGKNAAVYGDDIIVPFELFIPTCDALRMLSFTVNQNKSYSTHGYRESCGAHCFNGARFRPAYIRGRIRNIADMYGLINDVMSFAIHEGAGLYASARFRDLHLDLIRMLPRALRKYSGPPVRFPGEFYFISPENRFLYDLNYNTRDGAGSFLVNALVLYSRERPRLDDFHSVKRYLLWLNDARKEFETEAKPSQGSIDDIRCRTRNPVMRKDLISIHPDVTDRKLKMWL